MFSCPRARQACGHAMERVEILVVGAGAVGLAIARGFAR
jgi:malic enzyme